jgi:hypothetical protein
MAATQLMARIRTVYAVNPPVRTLFSDPAVAGLATSVSATGGGAQDSDAPRTLLSGDRR